MISGFLNFLISYLKKKNPLFSYFSINKQAPKIELTGYGLSKPRIEQKYLPYGSYFISIDLVIDHFSFSLGDINKQSIFSLL